MSREIFARELNLEIVPMLRTARLLYDTLHFKLKQRQMTDLVPHEPHFDEEFTAWFREALLASRSYVEYGSGGSTLLADRLRIPTISVESDWLFASRVRANLSADTTVRLLTPSVGITGPWGRPMFTDPTPARLKRWASYVEAPMRLGDSSPPSLCLVDGRFRRACALAAARWAQQAGASATVCVDDYFVDGRTSYFQIERALGQPRRIGRAAVFSIRMGEQAPVSQMVVQEAMKDTL